MANRPYAVPIDERMLAPVQPMQAPVGPQMPALSPVQARSRMDNSLSANRAGMFAMLKAQGMDDRQARAMAFAQGKMDEANMGDQVFGTGAPGGFYMQRGLATNADARANMLAGGQNAYMRGLGEQASGQGYNSRMQADVMFPAQAGFLGAQGRSLDTLSPARAGAIQRAGEDAGATIGALRGLNDDLNQSIRGLRGLQPAAPKPPSMSDAKNVYDMMIASGDFEGADALRQRMQSGFMQRLDGAQQAQPAAQAPTATQGRAMRLRNGTIIYQQADGSYLDEQGRPIRVTE